MRKSHLQFFGGLAILFFFTLAGWGCGKTGATATSTAISYAIIMNQAPYGPACDMYLNDTLVSPSGGIPPGEFSEKYGSIIPGTYNITFDKAGTDSLLAAIPATQLVNGGFYTLFLYNSTPGGGPISAAKITDDFSTLSQTNANYRFFNLSPDASPVDVYLNGTVVQSGRTTADNTANAVLNNFQTVAPAIYTVEVKSTTTDSVLATLTGQNLTAGNAFTIFLSGTDKNSNNLTINILQASN
jgi:Domain of unknown function (DUF4397)